MVLLHLNYYHITAILSALGFTLHRELKDNIEVWRNPHTNRKFHIENHADPVQEKELQRILDQAGVNYDEFKDAL